MKKYQYINYIIRIKMEKNIFNKVIQKIIN